MSMTKTDTLNYRGELFLIGQNQTPFLRAIAPRAVRSSSFKFPVAQAWTPGDGAQPAISEDTASAAGTPATITRDQRDNICQIDKRDVSVSFKKQSQVGQFSGLNVDAPGAPANELEFQKMAQLLLMAKNAEYSFLQGTYADDTNSATASKTRGLIASITTNEVAAAGADLSLDLINELIRLMYAEGTPGIDLAFVVNAFQAQQISSVFGWAPADRNVGGLSIKQVLLDIVGAVPVFISPAMATDTVVLCEMSAIRPVFVPVTLSEGGQLRNDVSANGVDVLYQQITPIAAAQSGFFYTQYGLDHGVEEWNGKITGLSTTA